MNPTISSLEAHTRKIVRLTGCDEYRLSKTIHGYALLKGEVDIFNCGHISIHNLYMRMDGFIKGICYA
jgi:hypothetical protein